MKSLLSIGVCLGLIGCVVVVETPPPYVRQEPPVEQPAPVIVTSPKPTTPSPVKSVSVCDTFTLPERDVMPAIPNIADPKYHTQEDVENALVLHIRQLRTLIKKEREKLDHAYGKYVLSCRR